MKIKTIAAKYGRKINLGDYSSLELEATSWADLDEGEDPVVCEQQLFDMCREQVAAEAKRIVGKPKGISIAEFAKFMGLEITEG